MQHRTNQNRINQNRHESNASNFLRSFKQFDFNQIVKNTSKFRQVIGQSKKESELWKQQFGRGTALKEENTRNNINALGYGVMQTALKNIVDSNKQRDMKNTSKYQGFIKSFSRNADDVFNPTSKNPLANGPLGQLMRYGVLEEQYQNKLPYNKPARKKGLKQFVDEENNKQNLRKTKLIEREYSTEERTDASSGVVNISNQNQPENKYEKRPKNNRLASLKKRDNKTPRILEVIKQIKDRNILNQRTNNDYKQTNNDFFKHILGTITEESQPEDNKGNKYNQVNKDKKGFDNNKAKTELQNVKNVNVEVAGNGSKKPKKLLVNQKQLGVLQKKYNNAKTNNKKERPENKIRKSTTADYLKSVLQGEDRLPKVFSDMRKTIIAKKLQDEQKNQQKERDMIEPDNKHWWFDRINEKIKKNNQMKQQEQLKKTNSKNTIEIGETNNANEGEQVKLQSTNKSNNVIQHGSTNNNQAIDQEQSDSSLYEIDDGIGNERQSGLFYTTMQSGLFNTISNQSEMGQERKNQPIRWYRICTKLPRKQRVSQTNPFKDSSKKVRQAVKRMNQRLKQMHDENDKLNRECNIYGQKYGEKKFYAEKLGLKPKPITEKDFFKNYDGKLIKKYNETLRKKYNQERKKIYDKGIGTVPKCPGSQQRFTRW